MSTVTSEDIQWLWKPWLALGKISTLDGDPGVGKSLTGAYLGKVVTNGGNMPDGSSCLASGGVVVIMPEDGLADTVVPRFARAGADLAKVSSIGTIRENNYERPFLIPKDLGLLEHEIDRVSAKLVYIDPVMAVLGGDRNVYKDNEVREALFPLKTVVEKKKVCCVLVRHLTKVRGENPLMAGGGSIAVIGLARTGLMASRHPDNESEMILSLIKSNIGPLVPGIRYTIHNDEDKGNETPYIKWGEVTDLTGTDLMMIPRMNVGNNRREILDCLKKYTPEDSNKGMHISDIEDKLPDISKNTLQVTLKRLYDDGEIEKPERGVYRAK